MKLHSFPSEIIFFSIICIFFIIPPYYTIFSANEIQPFVSWNFPFQYFLYFIFSIALLLFYKNKDFKISGPDIFYKIIFPPTYTFGLLFCFSLIFKAIATIFQNPAFFSNQEIHKPSNWKEVIFCIMTFLFSATFEETIYRFYFPETILKFLSSKKSKLVIIIVEFFAALIFAAAHLYLGILAVANALYAHFILRLNYKKSGTVISNIAAHFCYNLLTLLIY